MTDYKIGDKVELFSSDSWNSAKVTATNNKGQVQLKVDGWIGLHWFPTNHRLRHEQKKEGK